MDYWFRKIATQDPVEAYSNDPTSDPESTFPEEPERVPRLL